MNKTNAEIICVGTELVLGDIVNTNSQYLARSLASIGINVYYQSAVGDNPRRLVELLAVAVKRSNVIIFTGGLGPTQDDLTIKTVCDALGIKLTLNQEALANIKQRFESVGKPCDSSNMKQAYVPEKSTVFQNSCGTAPGCAISRGNQTIVFLPGPPSELQVMFETCVRDYLGKLSGGETIFSQYLHIFGLAESVIASKAADLIDSINPTVAPYAKNGETTLRVTAKSTDADIAKRLCERMADKITERFGDMVYGTNDDTMQSVVVKLLKNNGKTLSTAESCTAGYISKRITDISGSSQIFKMGVVTYSNESKMQLVNVPESLLNKKGAVSAEVAAAMAKGARVKSGADIGLSVTGIAGPESDDSKLPVGLAFIGLSNNNGEYVIKVQLSPKNDREFIRFVVATHALNMVRMYLLGSINDLDGVKQFNATLESPESAKNKQQKAEGKIEQLHEDGRLGKLFGTAAGVGGAAASIGAIKAAADGMAAKSAADTAAEIVSGAAKAAKNLELDFDAEEAEPEINDSVQSIDLLQNEKFNRIQQFLNEVGTDADSDEIVASLSKAAAQDVGKLADSEQTSAISEMASQSAINFDGDDSDDDDFLDDIINEHNRQNAEAEKQTALEQQQEIEQKKDEQTAAAESKEKPQTKQDSFEKVAEEIKKPAVAPIHKNEYSDELSHTRQLFKDDNEGVVPTEEKQGKFKRFLKKFLPWKGDKTSEKVRKTVFLAALITLIVVLINLALYYLDPIMNAQEISSVRNGYDRGNGRYSSPVMNPKFAALYKQNSDLVGWITIDKTVVDYPVVQADDNDFYLEHGFNKAYTRCGSIFMDYTNSIDYYNESRNLTLYGHNMNDGSMFAKLRNYRNLGYYQEHPLITFDTLYNDGQWKIFSVMTTNSLPEQDNGNFFEFRQANFADNNEFMSFVAECQKRSCINTTVDVLPTDTILTLQTCVYEFTQARLVVMARRVRRNETTTVNTKGAKDNPNAKYPQAWYDHYGSTNPYKNDVYTPKSTVVQRQTHVVTLAAPAATKKKSSSSDDEDETTKKKTDSSYDDEDETTTAKKSAGGSAVSKTTTAKHSSTATKTTAASEETTAASGGDEEETTASEEEKTTAAAEEKTTAAKTTQKATKK